MIDFWLAAGLLLLVALSFLLIPLLRGRRAQSEEDRTALNVALYQERLAELQTQQAEGVLTAAQMDSGRAEAARELLADTEGASAERVSRLGKPLPLLVARATLRPAYAVLSVAGAGIKPHTVSRPLLPAAKTTQLMRRSLQSAVARATVSLTRGVPSLAVLKTLSLTHGARLLAATTT